MSEFISANEPAIRLGFFLGIFAAVVLWEFAAPHRKLSQARWLRWYSNLGIVVLNTVVLRLLIPLAPVALAIKVEASGWGVLNLIDIPFWLAVVL